LLLYYITDRTQFSGDETSRRSALLANVAEVARCGVDFIQLREKDLPARQLEALAHEVCHVVRENSRPTSETGAPPTRLLINSRSDVAISCGAVGVHLRSNDISPQEVRKIWAQAGHPDRPVIAVSCHSLDDVGRAADAGADLAVLAPIFEKQGGSDNPTGLDSLREACRKPIPVIALGGVTLEKAAACEEAGAAGIAGIRLFQQNDIEKIMQRLSKTLRSFRSLDGGRPPA
jgi:thiamine-phosphate pyrophosphorylase